MSPLPDSLERRPSTLSAPRGRLTTMRGLVALVVLATTGVAAQEREGTVAVKYVEGTLHGFLRLRNSAGKTIADDELLQVPRARGLDSRMVFRFRDQSFFEERVAFTQLGMFRMETYSLIQRGPSFAEDLQVNLERSGKYDVKVTPRGDGKTKSWSGTMDLPADRYNGMIITIAKNLARGDTQRVHIVAFTRETHGDYDC